MRIQIKIKAYLLKILTKKQKNNFNIKNAKSVLILRYDRIGDMVVTTPVFRELKRAYPDINITVLASKENKDVILNNPYIFEVYTNYKNSLLSDLFTLIKLRNKHFDVCIEFDHSVIIHAIIRLKIINPKKIISIYKDGRYGVKGSELELYDFYTNKDTKNHFSKIWLDTLIFFGINSNSTKYDFFLSDLENEKSNLFISNINKKFKIGINIEAFSLEKRLKLNELKDICEQLYAYCSDIKIILLSSPSFMKHQSEIISAMGLNFVTMSHKTPTIIDAAALIKQLDLVISPDTSIVHIASAFNIPIISIHESNKESYRLWAPQSELNSTIFAMSEVGLFDYNVDKVASSAIDFIKTIELEK
ncbi:glycosyltransferase family 9 protein [Candidatus Thioglobus sp.]|nr:glycosyltransferase family 9 protein [Candidatus Thioglobus sp.]